MAPNNSEHLRNEFDRRLGRRSSIAKRSNTYTPEQNMRRYQDTTRHAGRSVRTRIATGNTNLPSDLKKRYKRQFGPKQSVHDFQKTMNNIVDETVRSLQKKAFIEKSITSSLQAGEIPHSTPVEDKGSPSLIEKGINMLQNSGPFGFLTTGDIRAGQPLGNIQRQVEGTERQDGVPFWQGLMEDFSRSPVSRAMDLASRPFYGVAEGLQNSLEQGYTDRDAGKEGSSNPLNYLDDLGEGFWKGFSGQEKTGAGDVWRTMRDNSNIAGAEELRELDESKPGVTRWLDRAVGLAGEVTMDPTNYLGLGAAGVIRNTGETLTEQTVKSAARDIVDDIARDFYDNVMVGHAGQKGARYLPDQDSLAIYAAQKAEDDIEKSLLEISGGTHAGFGKMGGDYYARATSQRVTEVIRGEMFKGFDNRVDRVIKALDQGGNLPPNSWRTHAAQSPDFDEMITEVLAIKNKNRSIPMTRNEFIISASKSDIDLIRKAATNVKGRVGATLANEVTNKVWEGTRQLYYNTLAVRIGKKKIPLKTFGKAYGYVKGSAPKGLDDALKHMSYERNFPGRLSIMTQNGRSIGVEAFENFKNDWKLVAKNISQDQDKMLYKALGDPAEAALLPPELYPTFLRMRHELDQMPVDEVIGGARAENYVHVDNYVPVYNRGGEARKRADFKKNRKNYINHYGNTGGYNYSGAAREGLKPVDSAFEALLIRKMKSTRDLARASFMKDLIENYGMFTRDLTAQEARMRNIVKIDRDKLPQYMRSIMDKEHVSYYLPVEHDELFKNYVNMSKWDSRDQLLLIREWAKLTNHIKYLSTVPRAGFHIRNFLGDVIMGMFDKIPFKTYSEVTRKGFGPQATYRISNNISLTGEQLKGLYDRHANSGFFETEIPLGGTVPTAGQHVNNARKRAANFARNVSDAREDYGRIVHFLGALRQEAIINGKRIKDTNRVLEKSIEAAVWRVNKYKFDYGALTATERKAKLIFPFYTFTRKAMPTLMQQLVLNPRFMTAANRFMQYNDGSAADLFNHYLLPDYVKDAGYATLTNEEEPLYIDQGINPASVLNSIDFTNGQQFAQSIATQMNPLIQLPFEMANQKDVFSGRPTGDFQSYLKDTFFVNDIAREIAPGGNDDPWWLQALNEGYLGANVGVRQFGKDQQEYGANNLQDRFVDDPFREFNRSQDRYRIYISSREDGDSYRVEDTATNNIIIEGTDPRDVLAKAQRLMGG